MTGSAAMAPKAARPGRLMRVRDQRGSISVIMAMSAVPLVIALGVGVDMSRFVMAKAALQSAADRAALAGANAYQSNQMNSAATTAANEYFNSSTQGLDAMVGGLTVSAAPGTVPGGGSSLNVTVDVTATMPTTLMAIASISSMTITAHSVAAAANPGGNGSGNGSAPAQPVITIGPGFTVGAVKSTASDWNSAYMYAVPNGSNGQPDYTKFPPLAQFFEIGSNCNSGDSSWSQQSRCNGQFGATVPASQNFPTVASTQPLAFLFVNMNNGEVPANSKGYGPNQYGAAPGYFELITSAALSLNQSPSQNTDNSINIVYGLTGHKLNQGNTDYDQLNGTAHSNCAIQIVQVDPNNLPNNPPYPGVCLSPSDPRSGSQYANMSCAQIAGRTFMYWWNDMGAPRDDYDYKNLYYTIRCVPGSTNPNGGTLTGTGSNSGGGIGTGAGAGSNVNKMSQPATLIH